MILNLRKKISQFKNVLQSTVRKLYFQHQFCTNSLTQSKTLGRKFLKKDQNMFFNFLTLKFKYNKVKRIYLKYLRLVKMNLKYFSACHDRIKIYVYTQLHLHIAAASQLSHIIYYVSNKLTRQGRWEVFLDNRRTYIRHINV